MKNIMNIGKKCLRIEKADKTAFKELEDLVSESKKRISPGDNAVKFFREVDDMLKNYIPKEDICLCDFLLKKEKNCLTSSLVYHSIGEELGIPVEIVRVPEHLFVRIEENGFNVNWETDIGNMKSDKFYIGFWNIAPSSLRKGVFMKNLSREQIKASVYNNIGGYFRSVGDLNNALTYFNKAVNTDKLFASAYNNRGYVQFKKGILKKALDDMNTAIDLHPTYDRAYDNRGRVRLQLGMISEAVGDFLTAGRLRYSCARIKKP